MMNNSTKQSSPLGNWGAGISYEINKGVGRSVEFKGLKAQYLFIFAGGLLGTIVLVAILYLLGVNQFLCLIIGSVCAAFIAWKTFTMNKRYGQHGLMKISARKFHPRYLINRKRPRSLLKRKKRA